MIRPIRTLTILGCLLAAGCAQDHLAVTYECDPPGAMLYSGDRNLGHCPTKRYFPLSNEQIAAGKIRLKGKFMARWASGASQSLQAEGMVVELSQVRSIRMTFARPKDAPGYETDARYALEYERNRLLARQVKAQQRAASAAEAVYWDKVFSDAFSPLGAGYQPGAVGSCTSQDLGGIITTNCY